MHRALLIREVIQMIMQNFVDTTGLHFGLPSNKGTLYHAALTCSSFLEPALDVMWYDLNSPTPLFKLLSNFELERQDKRHVLWGPILEADLKTFNKYASRVHCYHYSEDNELVDISAFIMVLRACRRSYIFPNLLDLIISEYKGRADPAKIMFLMPPCLRKFQMSSCSKPRRSVAIILNSFRVTTLGLNVSCLTLRGLAVDDRCISVLCLLSRLQELSICEYHAFDRKLPEEVSYTFNLAVLPHLSCKKTLRKLKLDWSHIIWSVARLDLGTRVEFSSLESIDFKLTASIGPFAELFRYVTVPGLKQLHIELEPLPSKLTPMEARCWWQFFDLIGKATTDNFRIFRIIPNFFTDDDKVRECWEDVGLIVSDFPGFDNLTLETFSMRLLSSLGRNDLKKVSNSWPRLSSLALRSYRSELDFTAVVDIAVGQPHLEILELTIGVGGFNKQKVPLLAHKLESLCLDILVPVTDDITLQLAQCIDRLFPYVKYCTINFRDPRRYTASLTHLLRTMQSARNDELERTRLGITLV